MSGSSVHTVMLQTCSACGEPSQSQYLVPAAAEAEGYDKHIHTHARVQHNTPHQHAN